MRSFRPSNSSGPIAAICIEKPASVRAMETSNAAKMESPRSCVAETSTASQEEPGVYLQRVLFPVLLPGLEAMLRKAKETERRRLFNPLDFLCEYLYRHNPHQQSSRSECAFSDIPFVKAEWERHPRPPLPLSTLLTEEEAATLIQAGYRAYRVRCRDDVQVFRQWLKGYRREKVACRQIQRFWRSARQTSHHTT